MSERSYHQRRSLTYGAKSTSNAQNFLHRPLNSSDPSPDYETLYWPEDGVENLEGYRAGGYHPTHLGDEFSNGRYEVVHKLGYGSYSTVWLARDRQKERYVALKMVAAEASPKSTESRVMRRLQDGTRLTPDMLSFPRCWISSPSTGRTETIYAW